MSQMNEIINAPPRIPSVPQAPLPQTNYGTLEHTGLPFSEQELITDIPPDFGWMSAMQIFDHSFEIKKSSKINFPLDRFSVLTSQKWDTTKLRESPVKTWQMIPFTTSRWWSGIVSFKFLAIKPPRVTGKVLIRYTFEPYGQDELLIGDELRRNVAKEWDLGQSNICEFDVTAICPIKQRYTWIPRMMPVHNLDNKKETNLAYQAPSYSMYGMGVVEIEVAQRLQVGSIFPDQIRVLVFRTFKNASFSVPTDPRSERWHCFDLHNPYTKLT